MFGNGDVLYQYQQTPVASATATIGTVYSSGPVRSGLQYSCNGTGATISSGTAVLFEPPTLVVTSEVDDGSIDPVIGLNLRTAIEDSVSGGKIVFAANVTETPFNAYQGGAPSITKSLIFDGGDGAPINSSLALITGEHVVIHNLDLGTVSISAPGSVNMTKSTCSAFTLGTATKAFVAHSSTTFTGVSLFGTSELEMVASTLHQCHKNTGGGADLKPGSSAVFRQCVFSDNYVSARVLADPSVVHRGGPCTSIAPLWSPMTAHLLATTPQKLKVARQRCGLKAVPTFRSIAVHFWKTIPTTATSPARRAAAIRPRSISSIARFPASESN